MFFQEPDSQAQQEQNNQNQTLSKNEKAEMIASRIIFLLGLFTILLGVINNTVQPAKSYDKASKFNNKFNKFSIGLDLEIINKGGMPESSQTEDCIAKFKIINEILVKKNRELYELIDEYNRARSLSVQDLDIEKIIQEINKRDEYRQPREESFDNNPLNFNQDGSSNNSNHQSNQ